MKLRNSGWGMAVVATTGILLLAGCESAPIVNAEATGRSVDSETIEEVLPVGSPECLAAVEALVAILVVAEASSDSFSSTLRTAATGPASGFREVGTLSYAAAADQASAANAYRAVAPLSVESFALLAADAAYALDMSAAGLNNFAAASAAYGERETNLTTMELNRTASAAVDAPTEAAAAVQDATDESVSRGGNVCQ